MATLEREILKQARIFFENPKLKMKDILEWSTGDIKPQAATEIVVRLPNPGCAVCIFKANDKRK